MADMFGPTAAMTSTCPTCLFTFSNLKILKQHQCLIKICPDSVPPDLILRDQAELNRTLPLIRTLKSSPRQLFQFCRNSKTVVPGLYPLFFPNQGKNDYPVLSHLGCVDDSYKLLKMAAREGPVILSRHLKIKMGDKILEVDPRLLLPSNKQQMKGFTVSTFEEHIRVVKKVS